MLRPGYTAADLRLDMHNHDLSAPALARLILDYLDYTGCVVSKRTVESWRSGARSINDQSALMLQLTFKSLPTKEQTK
jgi:hypothetical protein